MSSHAIEERMTEAEATEIFAELFALLEDYAPTWYSEELHLRAAAALKAQAPDSCA